MMPAGPTDRPTLSLAGFVAYMGRFPAHDPASWRRVRLALRPGGGHGLQTTVATAGTDTGIRIASRRWNGKTSVRPRRAVALLAGSITLLTACSAVTQTPVSHVSPTPQKAQSQSAHQASPLLDSNISWKLKWSDEFNTRAGLKPWNYLVGGNGWSLKQLQWYDATNATISHGNLAITATRRAGGHTCWYGRCRYRSVRMNTLGIFSQTYGRFEARIKLPPGRGLWPAFWLEGANVFQVGWPQSGEIDVIETGDGSPNLVQGFAHAPNHHEDAYTGLSRPLSAGYHIYGVDWTPRGITWFVDGHSYAYLKAYRGWPFAHKFFLILDLAVGGGFPGPPNASTPFPARMLVDWIRVYREVGKS